jgi:hypothetical protein
MAVYFGEIDTFPNAKADKEQVVKIGEECMEVYSAWEDYEFRCANPSRLDEIVIARDLLLDECADVLQAIANMVAALGVKNFTLYVEACERRNRERGRYDA